MVVLADLWLAILLSAVFVFLASSVIHMALQIHKGDYGKLPGEANLLQAMRSEAVKPGSYMFPCAASMKEMCTPEMTAKMNQGPVGTMTVIPNGPAAMGKYLTWWFLFCVVVSLLCAYIARLGILRGAGFQEVLRLVSATAFLAYGFTNVTDSIWKGVRWGITFKFLIDGLVYALVTGATFAWLWPAAA